MIDVRDNAEVADMIKRAHDSYYSKMQLLQALRPKISREFYLNLQHIDRKEGAEAPSSAHFNSYSIRSAK